jgi:hypothetical protein
MERGHLCPRVHLRTRMAGQAGVRIGFSNVVGRTRVSALRRAFNRGKVWGHSGRFINSFERGCTQAGARTFLSASSPPHTDGRPSRCANRLFRRGRADKNVRAPKGGLTGERHGEPAVGLSTHSSEAARKQGRGHFCPRVHLRTRMAAQAGVRIGFSNVVGRTRMSELRRAF